MSPLSNPSVGKVRLFHRGDRIAEIIASRNAAVASQETKARRQRMVGITIFVVLFSLSAALPSIHRAYLALKAESDARLALNKDIDRYVPEFPRIPLRNIKEVLRQDGGHPVHCPPRSWE